MIALRSEGPHDEIGVEALDERGVERAVRVRDEGSERHAVGRQPRRDVGAAVVGETDARVAQPTSSSHAAPASEGARRDTTLAKCSPSPPTYASSTLLPLPPAPPRV